MPTVSSASVAVAAWAWTPAIRSAVSGTTDTVPWPLTVIVRSASAAPGTAPGTVGTVVVVSGVASAGSLAHVASVITATVATTALTTATIASFQRFDMGSSSIG